MCFFIAAKAARRTYTSHLQQLGTESTKGCVSIYLFLLVDMFSENMGFLVSLTLYLLCHFRNTSYSSKLQDSDPTLNPVLFLLSFGLQFDGYIWYLWLMKAKTWDREKYYCLVVGCVGLLLGFGGFCFVFFFSDHDNPVGMHRNS